MTCPASEPVGADGAVDLDDGSDRQRRRRLLPVLGHRREGTVLACVLRRDRLGGLIHKYAQVA
jgi:hypothetical protein